MTSPSEMFRGLELEEPSPSVRRRVMAVAGVGTSMSARSGRRKWYALGGIAAGLALGLGLALLIPRAENDRAEKTTAVQPAAHSRGDAPEPVGERIEIERALTELKSDFAELTDELELRVLHVCYPHVEQLKEAVETPMWSGGNIHAEEVETSMMLHLYPELVRMERAVREYPKPAIEYDMSSLPMGALSESGVFGDATVATFPANETPRYATNAHISFASIDQLITQVSWIKLDATEQTAQRR